MLFFNRVNCHICALIWALLMILSVQEILGDSSADSWLSFARHTKKMIYKCYRNNVQLSETWTCLKNNSLKIYDDILEAEPIPLTNSIALHRRPSAINATFAEYDRMSRSFDSGVSKRFSWLDEMKKRIGFTLATHNIRFSFKPSENVEARRRNRRQMFPAMIFGMAVLGVIIIPLGFNFLATIGGMALLFGKMALLIATITGIKRLGGGYAVTHGHYHTDHYQPYIDRQEPREK